MTNGLELQKAGKLMLGSFFGGVYPQDQLPSLPGKGSIVNVDTKNMPGTHWVSVFQPKSKNKAYVFDSFGRKTKTLLPHIFKQFKGKITDSDYDAEQRVDENDCGIFSIAWLLMVKKFGIQNALLI